MRGRLALVKDRFATFYPERLQAMRESAQLFVLEECERSQMPQGLLVDHDWVRHRL